MARGETRTVSISFGATGGVTEALAKASVGDRDDSARHRLLNRPDEHRCRGKRATWPTPRSITIGALTPEAQKLEAQAKKQIRCRHNHDARAAARSAPKFSDMKLIDYDQAKYEAKPAERKRLIARWDSEVGRLLKPLEHARLLAWSRRGPSAIAVLPRAGTLAAGGLDSSAGCPGLWSSRIYGSDSRPGRQLKASGVGWRAGSRRPGGLRLLSLWTPLMRASAAR